MHTQISRNLSIALSKLKDYHYTLPKCPVVYAGDDLDYAAKLYHNWDFDFPCASRKRSEEIGRLLVENTHISLLSHTSSFDYHQAVGDYYFAQNNPQFALCMYDFSYRASFPGNYAYLKRWSALLKIAETLSTRFPDRETEAISALNTIIDQYSYPPDKPSDVLFLLQAITRKTILMRKSDKKGSLEFLRKNLDTFGTCEPSFYVFCFSMELAEAFRNEESIKEELLELAAKHSEILPDLRLADAKHDAWTFQEKSIPGPLMDSELIREKLEMCEKYEVLK